MLLICINEERFFFFFGCVFKLSMYNKTKNRGLAFVEMGSPEEARTALENLESYVSCYSRYTLFIHFLLFGLIMFFH